MLLYLTPEQKQALFALGEIYGTQQDTIRRGLELLCEVNGLSWPPSPVSTRGGDPLYGRVSLTTRERRKGFAAER